MQTNNNSFKLLFGGALAMALPLGAYYIWRHKFAQTIENFEWKTNPIDNHENNVTFYSIGGYKEDLRKLTQILKTTLTDREAIISIGMKPLKGIILYGPPGCGKKLLCKAIANEAGAQFNEVFAPRMLEVQPDAITEFLHGLVRKDGPQVVLYIQNINFLWTKDPLSSKLQLTPQLLRVLEFMENLKSTDNIIVVGSMNEFEILPAFLSHEDRFASNVVLGLPSPTDVKEIFKIHLRSLRLSSELYQPSTVDGLAKSMPGYVGSDIVRVCKTAAMHAVNQSSSVVAPAHLKLALKEIKPASLKQHWVEKPDIQWSDIGGLEKVRKLIEEVVEYPIKYPFLFKEFRVPRKGGILLFGPPGCGKTMIAKAIANECNANFMSVQTSELLSKWFSESAANVKQIFDTARAAAPCIIFFDEFDSVARARGVSNSDSAESENTRVVNEILTQMDGLSNRSDVFIICATNRPHLLDSAVLRSGRLDTLIFIDLPDKEARISILKANMKKVGRLTESMRTIPFDEIAELTNGCSGADIANLYSKAFHVALRECLDHGQSPDSLVLGPEHFQVALKNLRKTIAPEDLLICQDFDSKISKINHGEMSLHRLQEPTTTVATSPLVVDLGSQDAGETTLGSEPSRETCK